ncbi:MAG TPA: hypothetical protein PLR18_04470 [bacterium]|jgi:hypothetical protein|nr:hypothetical protein [bacterium]
MAFYYNRVLLSIFVNPHLLKILLSAFEGWVRVNPQEGQVGVTGNGLQANQIVFVS